MTDLLSPTVPPGGGPPVSRLGLGTAKLGAFWQRRSVAEGLRAVHTALDGGVTLIDTADVYARGISERLVGRAVGRRDDVQVMTKVGLLKTPRGILAARRTANKQQGTSLGGLRHGGPAATCFNAGYVERAAHWCLRRQRRSALDVLLLHEPSVEDLHRGDFLAALERLQRSGDVRAWGASVRTPEAARAALDLPGLRWLQVEANLASHEALSVISDHPRAADVTVIALAVLGDGRLLQRLTHAGVSRRDAVVGLVEGAAALSGIDAVLLGMSGPQHVVDNLAALREGVDEATFVRVRELAEADVA